MGCAVGHCTNDYEMGVIETYIQNRETMKNRIFAYLEIIGCITTLRPPTLVATVVGRIRAVARTTSTPAVVTCRSTLWTLGPTVLRTTCWPTAQVTVCVGGIGAITRSGLALVATGRRNGTLYIHLYYKSLSCVVVEICTEKY